MKKIALLSSIMMFSLVLVFSGCKKDEDPVPPSITFKTGTGYTSVNTAADYGDTITIGINAKSNGTDKLIKFQILANGISKLDSTISTLEFNIEMQSIKGALDKEVWKFVTTDIAGNTKSDSIVITGNFGEINEYPLITLGAQGNTVDEGFLSFSNSTSAIYSMDEAFNHQADIDMFCFYENDPPDHVNLMSLAAPGSNISGIFTGATAPENYATKNLTFFCKTDLSAANFDYIQNDGLIQAAFDPDNKFKKAKLLAKDDVYAFKLQSGKLGILKILEVSGIEDGKVKFAVKIQK